MTPALTTSEWNDVAHPVAPSAMGVERGLTHCRLALLPDSIRERSVAVRTLDAEETLIDPEARHAVAALCLHDQLYGFGPSDVLLLRAMGQHDPDARMPANWLQHSKDLANRIEALLRPVVLDEHHKPTSKRGGRKA